MTVGLRALNRFASSSVIDRLGLRDPAERFLHGASKTGARTAATAGRTFAAATRLTRPARQPRSGGAGLFDLRPDDEQQMLGDAVREFALAELRPVAQSADDACAAPPELLAQSAELGLTMVGVPEELGGAVAQRSAVTAVLLGEALAQGDMGIALACLAPAGVSTALGLWGDADQQATYLPSFVGDAPPAAAVAVLEPRALFNPFQLSTVARRSDGGFVLDGLKALVPRAADAELLVVAAALDGAPALFIVESAYAGVGVSPEPAMGVRAAATGTVTFQDVNLPAGALLGAGSPDVYEQCVALSRIGWCSLAVGCGRAVLDYVIPYVKDR
ncbi:MAG TPA: acyl-CoA dehydrogenase family protein, partial [Solirubrobacteraceae bacterium]|nr:acyl-CoA dehydrogenase family protein [Solirubrobacteraceae bacterium]